MESLWNEYENCTDSQEKTQLWKDLIPVSIKDYCITSSSFQNFTNYANTLARKFLSAIYEECSLCEDEPDGLVQFLSKDYGCHLLLSLNCFASHVTSCGDELCNLLLSIVPLVFQNQHSEECRKFQEFFSAKSDSFNSHLYFHYVSRILCNLPTSNLENINLSSDDDLRESNQPIRSVSQSDEEVLETIEGMKLDRQQLFFHLFSTILGLVQNEVISKELNCCVSYLEKCFTFLATDNTQQNQNLPWHYYYGMNHLAFVLLNDLSNSNNGTEKILSNYYYSNFFQVIQSYTQKLSKPIYLFLSLDSFCHITTCLSQSLNLCMTSSCHNGDLINLCSQFVQLSYLDVLGKVLIELDNIFVENPETIVEKMCYQRADSILKHLVKISKQVKCIKGYCDDAIPKGQAPFVAKMHSLKESSKGNNRKHVSSDEEPPQKPSKNFNDSYNQSEESVENVSDFNDLFDESSDSGVERRVKEKNTNKKSVEIPPNKKDVCFISSCINPLKDVFVNVHNQQQLQIMLLHSMAHIGVCRCIDLDQFLLPIVTSLSFRNEKVMDKTLSLICFLLSSNWDIINQKSTSKRRYSTRHRSKSRSTSSTAVDDVKPDVEKSTPITFHFLTKFKTYLTSQMTVLKTLLLRHLKTMTKKMPTNMQQELFGTILLPNFRNMFPTGKMNISNVQFSMSEDLNVIHSYLDLLYICMTSNEELAILFHKHEGSDTLHNLALIGDYETSSKAVTTLEYLCNLGLPSYETTATTNNNKKSKSKNVDEGFKATLKSISEKAILTLVQIGSTQLNNALDKDVKNLFNKKNHCLLDVLQVLLVLLHEHDSMEEVMDSTVEMKCERLLCYLFEEITGNIASPTEDASNENRWNLETSLQWLKVLLPIQLIRSTSESSHTIILEQLEKSFLHEIIMKHKNGEKVFLTLLNSSTICMSKGKRTDIPEKEEILIELKASVESNTDDRTEKSFIQMEEKGYEADQDSDDSSDYPASSHHTHLFVTDHNKVKTSLLTSTKMTSSHTIVQVKHPWLVINLLEYLAEKAEQDKKATLGIVRASVNLLFEYLLLDASNISCLRDHKFLITILNLYSFVFVDITEETKDVAETLSKMIVKLTSIKINAEELKKLMELFKIDGIDKKYLSKILWGISQIYETQCGPKYHLVFPTVLNKELENAYPQVKLQHRTQAFMIPKQEPAFRQSQLRSQSLSSMYEMRDSMLKPISYSNQPSSWEASAIQLPLGSTFTWPDKEFSLCLWYILEDGGVKCMSKNCGSSLKEKQFRQQSITLISQQSHESYGCEELYHLCSFGGQNAVFEVWIGARTGYFQYRWITSCYGNLGEEQLISYDQVVIQHHSEKNKWHHLVVSLVLPSRSQTSEIMSFLDGCQIPSVQMKYPGQGVQSQVKLSLLVGHAMKEESNMKVGVIRKPSHLLKTGVFMVFQGKTSFKEKGGTNMMMRINHQPLVDKVKAIYLYYLGPNNANIDTEYQEYFSNQNTSHMDSSLDWDSIVFKELSFCMSVISEKLISDKFPMDLLESPIEVLTNIKAELQTTLMLIFNPRNQKEFLQFIPQLKTLGNIQHTYLNDAANVNEKNDGTALPSIAFCKLQLDVMESFKDAVHNCGGISILLYLHALVAEDPSSEEAQCSVLKTIFSVQDSCPFLLREMNDLAGYVLIKKTIHQSPCSLNTSLMRALLESACDGDLFLAGDVDDYTTVVVNQNTSAIVRNVCILQMLLKDWSLIRKADFEVQEILWQALETLVRPSHPNVKFNVSQFQRARVVENLLIGCQEVQQEKYFQLPPSICRLFIGVITNLLGQPADLPVLKAVCSFLIAIHPTLDTLTLHSAQNFYLIGKTHMASASNVKLRETPKKFTKSQRNRRTASFNEADLTKSPIGSLSSNISPQVILSQENLASGSMLHSEVILKRGSMTSLKDSFDEDHRACSQIPAKFDLRFGVDEIDNKFKAVSALPKTSLGLKIKGHRRIQSDGNIRPSTIALDIPMKISNANAFLDVTTATESQDYDIISDSELASSCEGHDEYLVVDGFIDQTLESFTPTAKEERNIPGPDVLYHLRLGLMQLIKNTLMLLPDNLVTRVFGTILRVEHLLVLVNQTSDKLREVALENLILYLQRGGRDCLANFNRFKGCHLLANQLHQHPMTLKIIESCITLLVSKPLSLNHISEYLEINDDNICLMAIVPCVTLLESSMQRPSIFGLFVKFLLKIFDRVEDLPLVAFEHGLADIISNIVCGLANEESGGMMTSWKKESFGHLLRLLDWLVDKACCTCQTLYFQMYKDLQLSLENIDAREREKRGAVFPLLSKTCRFLKYYLIQSALNVFKENDLYMALTRLSNKEDPQYILSPEVYGSGKSSAARNFIKKIRGTVQLLPQPTIATPTEIQERFYDVLSEAVKLATLFNKSDHQTDMLMFGHELKRLSCVHTHSDRKTVSSEADREFCKDLLEWFCKNIQLILSPTKDNTSWCLLVKSLKDEFITQADRVFINFVSPLRSKELRLHFVKQVMLYKDDKAMYQILLLTNVISKTRETFLACLHSILSIPQTQFTAEEIEMLQKFKKMIGRGSFVRVNDQKLLSEMSELRHKRREKETSKRREAYKRILVRNNELCKSIADHGMEVSKVIVEEQDRQRQKLLRVVRGKVSKDVEIRKTWRNLIHHVTQERALWYCDDSYPCSWQLDPTEGPFRMRKRLQRCSLEIPSKFFLDSSLAKKPINVRGLLSYLFAEHFDGEQPAFYSFKTNDTIRFLYHCKRVTPATKNAGEVLIGETHMYFVSDEILSDNNVTQAFFGDKDVISISWRYEEIREILKRRYSLQDNALEIFLTSGRTFLLAFESTKNRDEVFEQLMSRELPNLVTATMDLVTLTNRWKEGHITNFEYLTELNKKAGRSFNDLMQYPVLPFVLADYESQVLDLTRATSFRNLSKPIACQDKGKEERYIETYEYLKSDYEQRKQMDPENAVPPYHYSSHYSNSGTVLHFLVRLPPFTSMFLKYQDNQFDIPDRTFHSMTTTWKLSSFVSNTDVKELIPEFFFLQEFLQNGERYDMGVRQNKERVDHVNLPAWCKNDPRLFTLIHMQALESSIISSHIHNWVDMVFGYKQTGAAAVKATNVFHPATYFGVDVSSIKDTIHRRALQTMIETYGQTPLQLFPNPHPKRFSKPAPSIMEIMISPSAMENMILSLPAKERENSREKHETVNAVPEFLPSPIDSVIGVQWGDYCGSPSHQSPVVQWVQALSFPAKRIITSTKSLSAYLCHQNVCVLTQQSLSNVNKPIGMLTWGNNNSMLQVGSSNSHLKSAFNPMRRDSVTCCEYVPGLDILFVGGASGVLNVWPIRFTLAVPTLDVVGAKQNLLGHSDAITSICVCQPFSIAVTTSKDTTAIIWDLNRLCYIRSITGHNTAVQCVAISESTGDIATACNEEWAGVVYLWTVNAKPIGEIKVPSTVNCLAFSSLPDGVAVNVIAAGMSNGLIKMWDTWTLQPLRSLIANSQNEAVIAMAFSKWNPLHLFSADDRGNVYLWTSKDLALQKSPNFVLVAALP